MRKLAGIIALASLVLAAGAYALSAARYIRWIGPPDATGRQAVCSLYAGRLHIDSFNARPQGYTAVGTDVPTGFQIEPPVSARPWPLWIRASLVAPVIPLWVIATPAIPTALYWILATRQRRRRIARGHCPTCDYDLDGHTGTCPECGRQTA